MSIINDIRACLDTHLAGTSGIPVIAPQNVPYEHLAGTPYIKATLIPTSRRPAVRGLNPSQRYEGIYSLLVCVPEANGAGAGYDIADDLLTRFNSTTDITYNGLTITVDFSEVRTSFLDSPFYCTPVNVNWYVYH